MHGLDCG